MREYINLIQQLSEAKGAQGETNLAPSAFTDRKARFEKFISKISRNEPFLTMDNQEVYIDPSEASRLSGLYDLKTQKFTDSKGAQVVQLAKGTSYNGSNAIRLSDLKKTTEFGGAAAVAGAAPEEGGKGSFLLKPNHIGICDKPIPASDLYDVIANNQVLNSTDYGKIVIELAKYIVSGESVTLPKEAQKNDKLRSAIQDNAGEYLGVLALLYGRSRFPRRAQFEEWLGSSLEEIIINFPSAETEKLADSYAELGNSVTGHKINISSKGYKGGAAPAMSGLKVPDHMRKNPKLKNSVAFIDACMLIKKVRTTVDQAFDGIDILYNAKPESISKVWHKFLPFSGNPKLKQSILAKYKGADINLPKGFDSIIAGVNSKEANDGGKIFYAMKKQIEVAINDRDALPDFKAAVLEILEMNFIQQYTDYEKKYTSELTFATQWPAKLDGEITLENKCSAKNPFANGLSFKLGRTDSSVSDEPDEVSVDGLDSDDDFMSKADSIAGGAAPKKAKPKSAPAADTGNVGRKKR